jgi:hypothetical protein
MFYDCHCHKKNFSVHIINLMSLKVEGKLDLCPLNLTFHCAAAVAAHTEQKTLKFHLQKIALFCISDTTMIHNKSALCQLVANNNYIEMHPVGLEACGLNLHSLQHERSGISTSKNCT